MSCERFRNKIFRAESKARIEQMLEILADYPNQRLSARQMFYQLVSRGLLPNTVQSYKLVTNLLTDARYAGLVDWNVIEDRGREPSTPSEWDTIGQCVESATRWFRLPRWEGQDVYCELWCEKAALSGVLSPIANKWHATLMTNRGYSSASAMKESADRIIYACSDGQRPIIFYLGDHDPSGEDMVRDIRDRLVEFGVNGLEVRKVALTVEQIQRHNPPPNPAKLTDSRAAAYVAKYGNSSWELDALPPQELNRLVDDAFNSEVDLAKMQEIIDHEKVLKVKLRKFIIKLGKG